MSIFTVIQPQDKTGVRKSEVTTGLWSPNDTGSLSSLHTSSVQIGVSGEYFYDLYHLPTANTEAEVQFAVAYGHVSGAGSPPVNVVATSTVPTQVVYSQYKNILLESGSKFKFGTTSARVDSDQIYAININRSRVKQYFDPGNWQLTLSGSNGVFHFVDDSDGGQDVAGEIIASVAYNVRSGSLIGGINTSDTTYYGTVFPDYGVILLDPSAVALTVGFVSGTINAHTNAVVGPKPFAPYTGSGVTTYQYAHEGLVRSISSSMAGGYPFIARSKEEVSSQNYFITLNQNNYNYTNNPSCYTVNNEGTRTILTAFEEVPITYPTTIGLYNDNNELLAVAKLSRPIQKGEDKRVTVRVRLDY